MMNPDAGRRVQAGCEIDVHFVGDTTAEVELNDYVYTLKKRQSAAANLRSHRKQRETLC